MQQYENNIHHFSNIVLLFEPQLNSIGEVSYNYFIC